MSYKSAIRNTSEYSSERIYAKDLKKSNPLSKKEEIELAAKIRKGDENALERLIYSNLKFVVSIANLYRYRGLNLSELISAGNEGLVTAAKRFDGTKGFKFTTYAVGWIRQSIIKELRTVVSLAHMPDNRYDEISKLTRLAKEQNKTIDDVLEGENGESLRIDQDVLRAYKPPRSLDYSFDDKKRTFYDFLVNPCPLQDQEFEGTELRSNLGKMLSSLHEKEAKILSRYFGLDDGRTETLESIGESLGITKERVRQIKEKALEKLRHPSKAQYLVPYLEY